MSERRTAVSAASAAGAASAASAASAAGVAEAVAEREKRQKRCIRRLRCELQAQAEHACRLQAVVQQHEAQLASTAALVSALSTTVAKLQAQQQVTAASAAAASSLAASSATSIATSTAGIASVAASIVPRYASAGFARSATVPPYSVADAPNFPDSLPLSQTRNLGFAQPAADFTLTPSGLTIQTPGTYLVAIQAILDTSDLPSTTVVVLLNRSGAFALAITNSIPAGAVENFSATGLLQNVAAGTSLSLDLSSGDGTPATVLVDAWFINVVRLPGS